MAGGGTAVFGAGTGGGGWELSGKPNSGTVIGGGKETLRGREVEGMGGGCDSRSGAGTGGTCVTWAGGGGPIDMTGGGWFITGGGGWKAGVDKLRIGCGCDTDGGG